MNEHHFQTSRTARFYTLGELNEKTKNIWIVLHGYAQLAKEFIQPFESINNGENFIIAPEALNHFYAKGFSGRPAATWMTSEDRDNEINDYVLYLDNLFVHLNLNQAKSRIILLGFSQGVATASRWIHATQNPIDHFVIYAGEMGKELLSPISEKIKSTTLTYITGKNDPLISSENHIQIYQLMKSLNASIIEFDGGHEVLADVVKNIYIKIIETDNKS